METVRIDMPIKEARVLYRKYKEHRAYSKPIDWEIQRSYQLLAQGKLIIRAIESIKQAGLNEKYLPKLALAPASATHCHIRRQNNGLLLMQPDANFWGARKANRIRFGAESFTFPANSFPLSWDRRNYHQSSEHKAVLPLIPVNLRPKRGLENYHVLWEADWEPVPPRDPYLLRRIGKADLWLVVAHWDLTEIERAVLATRISQ